MFEKIRAFLENQKQRLLMMDGAEAPEWLTERERNELDFVAFDKVRQRPIGMMEMLYENAISWLMDAGRKGLRLEWFDLAQEGVLDEDTTTSKIATFTTELLPAVRRIFAALIAMDLVSVQPLGGPTGYIYWVDHIYTSDLPAEGITGGTTRLDQKQGAKTYTDSSEKGTIREIEAKLSSKLITSEIKKVATRWTLEAEQDFSSQWKLNLEGELMPELSNSIIREVNRKLLASLLAGAKNNVNWDPNPPAGDTGTSDKMAYYQTLWHAIVQANTKIIGEKYQPADWLVMNHNTYYYLERLNNFKADPNAGQAGAAYTRYVGTLSGGLYKVYIDPWFDDNKILVGRRGASWRDAVAYYAPYIPLFLSDKYIYNNDFTQFIRGAMTRYAYGVIPETSTQDPIKNGGLATVTISAS